MARIGQAPVDTGLVAFETAFPSLPVYRAEMGAGDWLARPKGAVPGREAALEELALASIAADNPAAAAYRDLIDDACLAEVAQRRLVDGLAGADLSADDPDPDRTAPARTLMGRLREPILAAPQSLAAQLRWIRIHWAGWLDDADLHIIDRSLGVLDEIERAAWLRARRTPGGGADDADAWPDCVSWTRRSRPSAPTGTGWRSWSWWPSPPTSGWPSCPAPTDATSAVSTRCPTRSSTSSRRGASRASGSSASGSAARPRGASSRCAATPTPWPRPTPCSTIASPTSWAATTPGAHCASGPRPAASAWPRTWCPTTWASIRAGSWSTRSTSSRRPSRPSRPTRSRARTSRRTTAWSSRSRTTTGIRRMRPWSSSASTRRAVRRATSTTATTARASPGTTRHSSTTSRPTSARRSSARSWRWPGASTSSASTPPWCWRAATSSASGTRCRGTRRASRPARRRPCRRPSWPGACRPSSGARWWTAWPRRCLTRCCWPRPSG